MKCNLLSNNAGVFLLRGFSCVEASVALQVLGVLCSLSFLFFALKKQLEEKAEYTLKSGNVFPIKTWLQIVQKRAELG